MPEVTAENGTKCAAGRGGDDARERGLAAAGRTPEDQRRHAVLGDGAAQEALGADHRLAAPPPRRASAAACARRAARWPAASAVARRAPTSRPPKSGRFASRDELTRTMLAKRMVHTIRSLACCRRRGRRADPSSEAFFDGQIITVRTPHPAAGDHRQRVADRSGRPRVHRLQLGPPARSGAAAAPRDPGARRHRGALALGRAHAARVRHLVPGAA